MSAILLVLAILCELVAALLGFGTIGGSLILGSISLGLVFGFGPFLVDARP